MRVTEPKDHFSIEQYLQQYKASDNQKSNFAKSISDQLNGCSIFSFEISILNASSCTESIVYFLIMLRGMLSSFRSFSAFLWLSMRISFGLFLYCFFFSYWFRINGQ